MKPLKSITGIILLLLISSITYIDSALSQNVPDSSALLFRSHDLLSLTLSMDIKTVLRDRGDVWEQHPASISYLSDGGNTVVVPLKIRTRGYFRRDPMNCNFPPLRLNFAKQTSLNTIFQGQDKLKLVTHCRSRSDQYEQNVLKEYLAYRLYNLFTDESYRVRLIKLKYADSEGKRDTLIKMGFLIEPTEQMAARNSCQYIEIQKVRQERCHREKTTVLSIFQYMIGNTDWSIPVLHNIDLIQKNAGDPPVAVPFDFDWCGLVNASYAIPAEVLGIDNVRTRLYRGFCRNDEEFEQALQKFRDREDEIYQVIDSVPHLSKGERDETIRYMQQFFKTINNPKMVRKEFFENCRAE